MVHLDLKTDNANDITLARFNTSFDQSYIQFSNTYNKQVFNIGLSNNNYLKLFNPNNIYDDGLRYYDNLLNVNYLSTRYVKNLEYTYFPIKGEAYTVTGNAVNFPYDPNGCFNFDDLSYWQSADLYNANREGRAIENDNFKFNGIYGDWIKIKFDYKIIPVGFKVNSQGTNHRDPIGFIVFASNDNITWTRLYTIDDIRPLGTNILMFDYNTSFYNYITVVVTRIVLNPSIPVDFFKLYKLQILSKPILAIDSKIKICNNNVYDIDKLNAKELFINNQAISSGEELNAQITSNALLAFKDEFQQTYNLYWKNADGCAYFDTNVVQKVAINKTSTNATFDINGSLTYLYKIITNSFTVTNIQLNGQIYYFDSQYLYIGRIKINSTDDNSYFNISLYSFDINKYYFQSINIYGFIYIKNEYTFNIYWDTNYDTTKTMQRFTDVYYNIITSTNSIYINFYIKFNDNLYVDNSSYTNITFTRDLFRNVIYIDEFNTTSPYFNNLNVINYNIISFEPTDIQTILPKDFNFSTLYKGIRKSSTNLNSNITYLNDINLNKITINNGLIISKENKYISFDASNIVNSYGVSFPGSIGNEGDSYIIDKVSNNIAYLNWSNPLNSVIRNSFIKFGDQSVISRNNIVFQVAGNCLIGTNNISQNNLNDIYLINNALVVAGSIYATTDISTDSDISYKYDIELIKNPLEKINKLNGYTFNRNDVNQCDLTTNNRYTGLIAQEVLKIMPEVITKKHDGKLRILYANLAGLFIEGIKDLDKKYNYINFKINICILFTSMSLFYLFCFK